MIFDHNMKTNRKYPIGSEYFKGLGVDFRVWAPDHSHVQLVLENLGPKPLIFKMKKEKDGYFSFFSAEAKPGTYYRYILSHSNQWLPDPASRYQPRGCLGASCVISREYPWTDQAWKGVKPKGHIVYEIHIGTFTEAGTFEAASLELPRLAKLGITLIEIMPINDFPGHFGWGYDGVNLFASTHLYGNPEQTKAFINQAHELGMGVILDVVYNHLGPEENTIIQFSKDFFSKDFSTEWGEAINFDLPQVREFFLTNAAYWIEEFHFDGLRVDATPWFFSSTPVHILEDLTRIIKKAGGKRKTLAIAENEQQNTQLIRPYEDGGYGFDQIWNDDFHHSAIVRLTGKREAYYTDYLGSPQEFISSIKYGFLYQGQYYDWQEKNRGKLYLDAPKHAFISFLENHDQLANSGHGLRLHQRSDPGNYRAMTCLFLLGSHTPLIFQGQEFNASNKFLYFSDHAPSLSQLVRKGRLKELAQFPHLATAEARMCISDPGNPLTFMKSKINVKEIQSNTQIYSLFEDLIQLRKTDPVFVDMDTIKIDGAVLGTDSFLIRYFHEREGDRLLLVNFGPDYYFNPCPEPLLAPPFGQEFEILWSSESVKYGGAGTAPINTPHWKILGHSAIVLKAKTTKRTKH